MIKHIRVSLNQSPESILFRDFRVPDTVRCLFRLRDGWYDTAHDIPGIPDVRELWSDAAELLGKAIMMSYAANSAQSMNLLAQSLWNSRSVNYVLSTLCIIFGNRKSLFHRQLVRVGHGVNEMMPRWGIR